MTNSSITKYLRKNTFYICFLLPALVLFIIFFIIPVVQSFVLSFTNAYGMRPKYNFIGLKNYIEAFNDSSFMDTIKITLEYTLIAVVFGNILSLVLALLLDSKIKFKNGLRAIFFIPNVMSLIVVGYVWRFVYSNVIPDLREMLGFSRIAILGNIDMVVPAIAIAAIWNVAGYYMVIYIAALQSISSDYMEAAKIDGANAFQILFRIKIPMLMPTIMTCLILSVAAHLKAFELPFSMTSGGPAGASTTMVLKIYHTAFNANRTGYATAQSTILFVIIAVFSFILYAISKKKEESIQ